MRRPARSRSGWRERTRLVTETQSDLASSHSNIGDLQLTMGRPAEALASCEQARAIWERLTRENPESSDFASRMGMTLDIMGEIELHHRRFDKAREKLLQAVECQRKALAANPTNPMYRRALDHELRNLTRAAEGLGRADEAEHAKRELDELRDSDPRVATLDTRLAAVLKGEKTPHDDVERIQLALACPYEVAAHRIGPALRGGPRQ